MRDVAELEAGTLNIAPDEAGVSDSRPKRLTQEQRRHQTRERLLTAASEVFLARGFVQASVDEIAEAAGFSKGAVYAHFASKENLFLAVFDRRYANAAPDWTPVLAGEVREAERLAAILRLLNRATEELKEQARSGTGGSTTWTLLEVEFVLSALRSAETRETLARYYERFRGVSSKGLALSGDQSWLLQALGIGVSILISVDPDAAPSGVWERLAPLLFRGESAVPGLLPTRPAT